MLFNPVRIVAFLLYMVIRTVYCGIQTCIWKMNGIPEKIRKSQTAEGYEESVHVQDVWFKCSAVDLFPPLKEGFITAHKMFTHPDYLKADNISLYDVNQTEALFIETDPDINIFDSDLATFIRTTQFSYARRIITMPIEAFHRFAEELGDPAAQVIILSSTGRCGSTLLTQMFEATGLCASVSEPHFLNNICQAQKKYTEEEFEKTICDSIRVMCKATSKAYSGFLFKTFSMNMGIVPALAKGMPQVKHLFMYRDTWDTQKSVYRTFMGTWIQQYLFQVISIFSPKMLMFGLEPQGWDYLGPEKVKKLHEIILSSLKAICAYIPLESVALYLYFIESGLPIVGVRYEDIKYNGKDSMESIFHYCGLHNDLVPKALESLSRDSQRGSSISRDSVKGSEELGNYEGRNKQIVDAICNLFGVPTPGENQTLPNTITCSVEPKS